MDRLSSDDNGELLLQPIGHCKELIDGLASMAVDQSLSLERRTDSARTLLGITQKAADQNIVYVNARTVRPTAVSRGLLCSFSCTNGFGKATLIGVSSELFRYLILLFMLSVALSCSVNV